MIDCHIEGALERQPYSVHFKGLWELTNQSDNHQANDDHYEQDFFGSIMTQPMYPPDEDMIGEVCIMVKRGLLFSLPELDEEIRKGWQAMKRK